MVLQGPQVVFLALIEGLLILLDLVLQSLDHTLKLGDLGLLGGDGIGAVRLPEVLDSTLVAMVQVVQQLGAFCVVVSFSLLQVRLRGNGGGTYGP